MELIKNSSNANIITSIGESLKAMFVAKNKHNISLTKVGLKGEFKDDASDQKVVIKQGTDSKTTDYRIKLNEEFPI